MAVGCNRRDECGIQVPSTCLPWQSKDLKSIEMDECGDGTDDVIIKMDAELDKLKKSLDITKLVPDCLDLPTTSNGLKDIKWYEVINKIISDKCAEQQKNVLDTEITMDLSCLREAGCVPVSDTIKLSELLLLFSQTICSLNNQIKSKTTNP